MGLGTVVQEGDKLGSPTYLEAHERVIVKKVISANLAPRIDHLSLGAIYAQLGEQRALIIVAAELPDGVGNTGHLPDFA